MEAKVVDDSIIIETIRALWRKRDIRGALALVVRIPESIDQKIWEATILIAKAELMGDESLLQLDTDCFDEMNLAATPIDTQIDMELVKGRIALVKGNFAEAEDYFFKSLLQSRNTDYLLGKVQSMVGLGAVKRVSNHFEQALDLAITAASLTKKLTEDKRKYVENDVLLLQCKIYLSIQDYEKLEPKATELLALSQECGETLKYVQAQNHMAIVHASKGDFKKAMPYFLDALDKCKQIEYHSLAVKIATNIATIHGQLNNYDEALARYHSILKEYKAPIRPEKRAVILNNLGNIYVRIGQWKEAISYFLEAEKIADEKDYLPLKRLAFCQVARCLIETESYDAFLTHMRSEKDIFGGMVSNGLQILHYVKAQYALSQNKYEEAIQWAVQAIEVAGTFNDDTTSLQTQSILAKAYEKNGDLSAALDIYKKYAHKKEELEKKRARNMIVNTEIDYILAAKEQEIHTLQRENQLQAELIKSTSLIRRKNKELVAKNEELSYFARMIALDFNRHLRVVGQFVDLLDHEDESNGKTKEYLGYIHRAVNKVTGLVAGLHRYAIVMDEQVKAVTVDISDVLQVISYDLKEMLTSRQLKLRVEDNLPVVSCGKAQLITVLKELIINAIQFSREGSEIVVSSQEMEGEYVLSVKDSGIGIPEGDEKKIFWPFYRSGRLPDKEGNGLGLAACKKIIERNGGRVKAQTGAEGGLIISIFWSKCCNQIED